jgi:hypothetical protein
MGDKILKEGRFEFDFSNSLDAFVADKPQYHGLSAVDFIVETNDKFLFIEVKDPDHPHALKFGNPDEFIEELKKPAKLTEKFKDSLLKELAKGRAFQKPVVYVIVLERGKLDAAQRRKTFENIQSTLPRFKEDYFPIIKMATCAPIYSISEFSKAFPMFKVTADVFR